MNIDGSVALVTGGAGGIGLAISASLVAAGARVVVTDVDRDELDRSVKALGTSAAAFALDVTSREGWSDARRFAESTFGPVDILANNAGIGPDGFDLSDMSPASFDRLVQTKLHGTFNGVSTFAPGMRERARGHVVNTASMAGLIAGARLGAYTSAMFAVVGLSEVLRLELEPAGVGVSVLCPGLVRTRLRETTRAAGIERKDVGPATMDDGIDPAIVGRLVIEGIEANRLYILTHGDYRRIVARRGERIVDAFEGVPRRAVTASDPLPGTDERNS